MSSNSVGWIKTHRKMREWEWYNDLPVRVVFQHLLLSVEHEDKTFKGCAIKAGERVFSTAKLAEECCLSVQQTKTALNKLKSTSEVTTRATNKFSVISITKWSDYQVSNQRSNQQTTSEATSRATTSKEDKKYTIPNGMDTPSGDVRKDLFRLGLASLSRQTGKDPAKLRALLAKWLKAAKDDAGLVLTQINQAEADSRADAISWITAAIDFQVNERERQNLRKRLFARA